MHAAAMGIRWEFVCALQASIPDPGIFHGLFSNYLLVFFLTAGPVSGHMISRLEAMTEDLGEVLVIRKEKTDKNRRGGKGR